jgi:DNA-binding response OmpR family regulator
MPRSHFVVRVDLFVDPNPQPDPSKGDSTMKQRHVLVSDDDPAVLEVIRIRLEASGFRVTTAQDAYQALSLARSERPDVLVLDINMPAGSGFSVQDRIAEIPEIAKTPVIFITGEVAEKVDRDAARRGAAAIMHKPFHISELIDEIRTALGYWTPTPLTASI